ncbi:MAG: two-component regulator propeller domain-containing protein [Bacteroidia bacterium]
MPTRPFLWFCLFCIAPLAYGQVPELGIPTIQNYSKQDYQAETQNWSINEDNRGLMYFGNNLGLLEFDGTYWRTYPLPNRSIVRSVLAHESGRVYIGGQDELGYFEPNTQGELIYHSLLSLLSDEDKDFTDVWKLFIREDVIYFQSEQHIFCLQNQELKVLNSDTRFEGMFGTPQGLYVVEAAKGLQRLENKRLVPVDGGEFYRDWIVTSIIPLGNEALLIATLEHGLFTYRNGQSVPQGENANRYLIENRIYCASKLSNGNIAIGTSLNGLLILDDTGQPIQNINNDVGLQNNSILSLHEGRDGNLWLGLENGISYIELSSPFSYINSRLGVEGSAYDAQVFDGKLYLATNQGIYFLDWSIPLNPLSPLPFDLVKGTRGPNWSLQNIDGNLLVGQHYGAAEIKGGRADKISPIDGAWKHLQLKSNPNYVIEGNYNGLLLYHKETGANDWTFVKKLEGFDESSRVFEEDNEGNIWVSHPYRGVFKVEIDLEAAQILSVKPYDEKDGFPSNLFINVSVIDEQLLFTTEKGVYQYELATDRFVPHLGFNQIFGDSILINRLIEDEQGRIWFSIDDEFGILQIEDETVAKSVQKLSFNRLQNRLVKGFESIYAYDESHIFIGTDEGFILYNPRSNIHETPPMLAFIREVIANNGNDSLIFGGTFAEEGKIKEVQPEPQIWSLDPSFEALRFAFSAPFFENINEVQYQYYLEGEDKIWSDWTNKTEKEYTNLNPGKYAFKVKARNIYGLESKPISYKFVISPHWYETNVARVFYLLCILGMLFGFARYQSVKAQKQVDALILDQAQALEQQEAEYKQEAQKSEAEIIRLRNEKLKVEVAHKNKELASTTMHLVQKGEIMLKIKSNLQKLSKTTNANNRKEIRDLIRTIDDDIRLDNNWEQFEYHFDQVHGQFLQNLRERFPILTAKDQRLAAYLRMNLSTKEIAQLMNISVRGVEISRYRLRKKLELDREINLNDFMMGL